MKSPEQNKKPFASRTRIPKPGYISTSNKNDAESEKSDSDSNCRI
jgi:hypothetical protein